ncbi:MAG: hypothetical protein FGF50_10800 [Candidatus Brockarchaeota archaeon]|nr:hypothetical protein [Candidatus Brockarchaeota archaeon]
MLSRLFEPIKSLISRRCGGISSSLLSSLALGRLAFWLSVIVKRLSLLYGSWGRKTVEYPWVLRQLKMLKPGVLVLDVGCAESLLSHELMAREFRLDIRDYPFKNKRMYFVKRDALNISLPSNIFDRHQRFGFNSSGKA